MHILICVAEQVHSLHRKLNLKLLFFFIKMNFSDRQIEHRYLNFVENAPCIEDYFQIPHSKYKLTKLTMREYKFEIRKENGIFVGLDLPTELRVYVNSFLYEIKVVSYKLTIPNDYPFKPPVWSIAPISSKHDELAVFYQNQRYRVSWSPVITFEKDILNMIDAYETCETCDDFKN